MQLLTYRLNLGKTDMRRVLAITLPAMVELVFAQLFGMVDTMMLGHTALSKVAIAAVGLTNNPINLLMGVLSAFNVGTTASVAWSLGAGDLKTARQMARTAMGLNMILGLAASLIGFFLAPTIVLFMSSAQPDLQQALPHASQYMQIVSLGFLAAAMNMGITASLRGAGQTRLPMYYNLTGNLLNVIGNFVLIFGHLGLPAMGVMGAAISTTVSRVVTLFLSLGVIFLVDSPVRLAVYDNFRLRWADTKRILRIGSTTAVEQCVMQVGFIFFARSVAGLNDTAIFAAHQIGLNINGLSWVPSQAFGVAATTLVGQCLGAGDKQRAKDYAKIVHRMALCGAALVAVLFVVGAAPIVRMYTTDGAVVALTVGVLRLMALGMPGIATQQPISAALRGAGDTMFPLIASMLGIWIFRVMVAPLMIFTLGWGLTGAWISIVLDQTTRAIVVYIRFASGKWMDKRA